MKNDKYLKFFIYLSKQKHTHEMKTTPLYELKKIQTNFPTEKITCSSDADRFARLFFNEDIEIFESCFILLLNNANKTIGYAKISQGGIVGTIVDVRLIAKYAIEALATTVILFHNHPSGNLTPSHQDNVLTEKVKNGLRILDVNLADHLILTVDGYYSFADKGNL
jgi:DNA repair protein RadC